MFCGSNYSLPKGVDLLQSNVMIAKYESGQQSGPFISSGRQTRLLEAIIYANDLGRNSPNYLCAFFAFKVCLIS